MPTSLWTAGLKKEDKPTSPLHTENMLVERTKELLYHQFSLQKQYHYRLVKGFHEEFQYEDDFFIISAKQKNKTQLLCFLLDFYYNRRWFQYLDLKLGKWTGSLNDQQVWVHGKHQSTVLISNQVLLLIKPTLLGTVLQFLRLLPMKRQLLLRVDCQWTQEEDDWQLLSQTVHCDAGRSLFGFLFLMLNFVFFLPVEWLKFLSTLLLSSFYLLLKKE